MVDRAASKVVGVPIPPEFAAANLARPVVTLVDVEFADWRVRRAVLAAPLSVVSPVFLLRSANCLSASGFAAWLAERDVKRAIWAEFAAAAATRLPARALAAWRAMIGVLDSQWFSAAAASLDRRVCVVAP